MITLKKAGGIGRSLAILWAWERLEKPEDFTDWTDWANHVDRIMDDSDLEEYLVLSDYGVPIGYIAYNFGECIHRLGTIMNISMMVMKPGHEMTREVWSVIKERAVCESCSWVARGQHLSGGHMKTIYTEV